VGLRSEVVDFDEWISGEYRPLLGVMRVCLGDFEVAVVEFKVAVLAKGQGVFFFTLSWDVVVAGKLEENTLMGERGSRPRKVSEEMVSRRETVFENPRVSSGFFDVTEGVLSVAGVSSTTVCLNSSLLQPASHSNVLLLTGTSDSGFLKKLPVGSSPIP